jgi:hypothetical protein
MNENDWDRIMSAAAEDVLETMFFTGIYGEAQSPPGEEPQLTARVAFEGTPCGSLTLRLSEPSALSLASNFLACESDTPVAPALLGGVVCELANMICGSLLSRVKSETQFRLGGPELLPADGVKPQGPVSRSLDLGDGTLDLWLRLESHAI